MTFAHTSAATIVVTSTADGGPGSLRNAVTVASPGDTITFDPGLSGQTISLTSGGITIDKNLDVSGPVGKVEVSAEGMSGIFEVVQDLHVRLSNLVLNGGIGSGGAVLTGARAHVELTGVDFLANYSPGPGGAIYNDVSSVVDITGGRFFHNRASVGGAIYNAVGFPGNPGVTLTVRGASFEENEAGFGNAIYVDGSPTLGASGGHITIDESRFVGNETTDLGNSAGGAIYLGPTGSDAATRTSVVITNSLFARNTSEYGGAIFIDTSQFGNAAGANVTVRNSTLSGNSVVYGGGAIFVNESDVRGANSAQVEYSTISDNSEASGAVEAEGNGEIFILGTIVANQKTGTDCAGPINSLGFNLDTDGSCQLDQTGDLPQGNARLQPVALNPPGVTETHAIGGDSDAFNRIPEGAVGCGDSIPTDQRGVSRPQAGRCDIGAYELACDAGCSVAPIGGTVDLLTDVGGEEHYRLVAVSVALGGVMVIAAGWWTRRYRNS
jgi:hypothetical protein